MNPRNHSWHEFLTFILAVASTAVFGFTLLPASATTMIFSRAHWKKSLLHPEQETATAKTFSGVITDSFCGAKHNAKFNKSAAECTQACVRNGAHYALVDGDKLYILEGNHSEFDRFAGERVQINGTLRENTIQVSSLTTE